MCNDDDDDGELQSGGRVVRPCLTISREPPRHVAHLQPCQIGELESAHGRLAKFRDLHEMKLACELSNLVPVSGDDVSLYVSVSLVTAHEPHVPHPFELRCSDEHTRLASKMLLLRKTHQHQQQQQQFLFPIDTTAMTCTIGGLFIVAKTLPLLRDFYEERHIRQQQQQQSAASLAHGLSEVKTRVERDMEANELEVNACRLALHVVMWRAPATQQQLDNYVTEPIYTRLIEGSIGAPPPPSPSSSSHLPSLVLRGRGGGGGGDESTTPAPTTPLTNVASMSARGNEAAVPPLRILRSSRMCGSMRGADEMFILVAPPCDPFDIRVEFVKMRNDVEAAWRSFAPLDPCNVHANSTLIVRTPAFPNPTPSSSSSTASSDHQRRVKVHFRLYKPSTREYSDKCAFYYFRDNDDDDDDTAAPVDDHQHSNELRRLFGPKRKLLSTPPPPPPRPKAANDDDAEDTKDADGDGEEEEEDEEDEAERKLDALMNMSADSIETATATTTEDDTSSHITTLLLNSSSSSSSSSSSNNSSNTSTMKKRKNQAAGKSTRETQTQVTVPPDEPLNTLELIFKLRNNSASASAASAPTSPTSPMSLISASPPPMPPPPPPLAPFISGMSMPTASIVNTKEYQQLKLNLDQCIGKVCSFCCDLIFRVVL